MAVRKEDRLLVNLKQLFHFITLSEHESISSAAKAANMTQPSMSENISKLEKALDITLVARGRKGIQLTEPGILLAQRGNEIFAIIDDLLDELRQLSGETRGRVALGITPSLSILLAVPLMETLHAEYPEIRLDIAEAFSHDVAEWVLEGRLDVGCVYETTQRDGLVFEPLFSEEQFICTAPDNWDGEFGPDGIALEPVRPEQLAKLPLVLTSPAHGARKQQEKYARSIGSSLDVIASIDSLPHIIEMVRRGSAYSILAHSAIVSHVERGELALVPFAEPRPRRLSYLVRKQSRPISGISAIIEAKIRLIAREMVERYHMTSVRME